MPAIARDSQELDPFWVPPESHSEAIGFWSGLNTNRPLFFQVLNPLCFANRPLSARGWQNGTRIREVRRDALESLGVQKDNFWVGLKVISVKKR